MHKKISVAFLLLSRALYLPQDVPTPEVLKATLSNLPENIVRRIKREGGERGDYEGEGGGLRGRGKVGD